MFGTRREYRCTKCDHVGRKKTHSPRNHLLQFILIIPPLTLLGIIYGISCRMREYKGCAECGYRHLVKVK